MEHFENREAAFASQNYDPNAVTMTGVPEHIKAAALGFINLCVAHDAVNPKFNPDFMDYGQRKYTAWHEMGSPSGAGFAYYGYDSWLALSYVGSRLSSESREAGEHIADICHEDYKAMKVYERKVE